MAKKAEKKGSGLPKIKRYVRTTFGSVQITPYLCPTCDEGRLRLDEKSVHALQTAKSRDDEGNHEDIWEPQYEGRRFTCLFVCDNRSCQEVVSVAGEMRFESTSGDDGGEVFVPEYEPTYMKPSPKFFTPPAKAPPDVEPELQRAFAAFWFDPGACANRIRCVVELMLTEQGFPSVKNGKYDPLGRRITAWRKKNRRFAGAARALEAVKWIGNEGSHPGNALTRDDLFHSFRMLEHALVEVYERVQEKKEIRRLAKHYTPKKGPQVKGEAAPPPTASRATPPPPLPSAPSAERRRIALRHERALPPSRASRRGRERKTASASTDGSLGTGDAAESGSVPDKPAEKKG